MKQTECIKLRRGDRKKVKDLTGIGNTNLTRALKFESNSLIARKARLYAVNLLGCTLYIDKQRLI